MVQKVCFIDYPSKISCYCAAAVAEHSGSAGRALNW